MRNQYRSVCLYGPQSALSWSMADATRVGGGYIELVNDVNKPAKITEGHHIVGLPLSFFKGFYMSASHERGKAAM